jgi:hypothetical protein
MDEPERGDDGKIYWFLHSCEESIEMQMEWDSEDYFVPDGWEAP